MIRLALALALCSSLASAQPKKPDAVAIKKANGHFKLGQEFFKSGQWDRAIAEYQAALDLTGAQPKALDLGITKGLPYVPTPLVVGDLMYLLGDGGILQCVEFKTGKPVYEERLNGSATSSKFFSSPIAADGKIFCGSQQGDVIVVKAGRKFEQISASKLDSPINASSAIGDGRLYVRTEKMLWCVGSKTAPVP